MHPGVVPQAFPFSFFSVPIPYQKIEVCFVSFHTKTFKFQSNSTPPSISLFGYNLGLLTTTKWPWWTCNGQEDNSLIHVKSNKKDTSWFVPSFSQDCQTGLKIGQTCILSCIVFKFLVSNLVAKLTSMHSYSLCSRECSFLILWSGIHSVPFPFAFSCPFIICSLPDR